MKIILYFIFVFTQLNASEYDKWLKEQNTQYISYKNNIDTGFKRYKKAQNEAFQEYKTDILKVWDKEDVSNKHKWVEYSSDYKQKKSIDYEKGLINLEVVASNKEEAKIKISKMFEKLKTYDVKKAFKNDILEQKIAKKLSKRIKKPRTNQKLISDVLNKKDLKILEKKLKKQKLIKREYKSKIIYKASIKLPKNTLVKKAMIYKVIVQNQSKKLNIPMELIYAIIHSESSFNPMAKSYVPAFGLMQIVPRSAGLDTYKYLTGKKKLLSSNYLFIPANNIVIGSTYLKILYFRYLKNIKDPMSRLYCTIAAYNTGAGNVSRVFIGNTNIYKASKVINKLISKQVYKKLQKDLPYEETKKYLRKVNTRMSYYHNMIIKKEI